MRITFARFPTPAHPDFKTQEVETSLSGINYAGLALVQREIKSIQHMPYRAQGLFYFARTQHNKIIRITNDARFQLPAQLMLVPYPVK